ncbi:helix-turn-helix transcriptional regulator [Neobacillus sp.]|uniref:helix-turn-helix domain-containing protein n=1 Tax=Neobacillus sp. TaxID=2675273 RepID=UPI002896EEB3|nr:helix-turn-helix transcriptional regulator [Neobacillus sp.]
MDVVEFGIYIKELRKNAGLTLSKLSEVSGVSHPYLSQIENGKLKKYPSSEILIKIAKHLNIHYAHLLKKVGYIDEGTIMVDGELLVSEEEYEAFKKTRDERYENEEDEENLFDLFNYLEIKDITYKGDYVTDNQRKLIVSYLDALFSKTDKED